MWTLLFLTVSLFSSFQCSPLVHSERRVGDFVLNSESATHKELQRNVDLGIEVTSSPVRTKNPSGISSTVTQPSIKHDNSTSLSLKNHADNKQYQTEKVLPKGVTDLNTKHKDFDDSKTITPYDTVTIDFHVGPLKNTSHTEKNDDKIKSLDENSKFINHNDKSESSVTTEEVVLRYKGSSNSDNEPTNTHNVSADDKGYEHDKETTKHEGRMIKANSSRTHLNETKSANKNIDPRTSGQRYADKNLNILKKLEEKEALNVKALTPSNVKNSTAEHKFSKATSKPSFKGKLVTVTEEVNLRYREGSNSYNKTTDTHNERADDKRHDHDEETTQQVEGSTKANGSGTHLNKTRSANQTTDPRTILMEQSGQRYADKNLNTLKMLKEKEVLNVSSLTGSNVKDSIVTEEVNLRYKEGSKSNNRTTNNHNESADGKRHDHDEEITKQVGAKVTAKRTETHLNETSAANQTKDPRTVLMEQSGQGHAIESVNTVKMLEGKKVLKVTTLTPRYLIKNSTAEPKILKTTKSLLEDILVFVHKAKNEKVNIKTPFIPSILLEA